MYAADVITDKVRGNIIDELEAEIIDNQRKIREIQDECSHPKGTVKKTHKSNTGNYDPHANCYWTNFYCNLCKKRWNVDGSK